MLSRLCVLAALCGLSADSFVALGEERISKEQDHRLVIQTGVPHATRDKPQSKLWFARNHWWAWLPTKGGSAIWKRTESGWKIVESLIPDLKGLPGQADVLSEDDHVSAVLAGLNQLAVVTLQYNLQEESYQLVMPPSVWNFPPVEKVLRATESATIARDSQGKLWIAWDREGQMWVRASLDSRATQWTEPMPMGAPAADDDLCTVVALPGKIGVLWSDQKTETVWFCAHRDSDPPETWQAIEVVEQGGRTADDHLNAKVSSDGTLYVATKNSVDTVHQPQQVLRIRRPDGKWENHPYAMLAPSLGPSRPIVLLGGTPEELFLIHTVYVARKLHQSSFLVWGKSETAHPDISEDFETLLSTQNDINNVTGCKQILPPDAPWIVLASDSAGNVYEAGLPRTAAITAKPPVVSPRLKLLPPEARDQDDMCFWIHPDHPEFSTIITSDKAANCLHVYDLAGNVLQRLDVPQPGNIDLRSDFPLGNEAVTIVAVNQRKASPQVRIWKIDPESRRLQEVTTKIPTGPNYGGCLYHSLKSGRFYFVATSQNDGVKLFELRDNSQGGIDGHLVRKWEIGFCEGAVADDDAAVLYVSEERKGVWKFGAEPDEEAPPRLIAPIGKNGTHGDMEGLAIYRTGSQEGYLLVSDQGRNRFQVFERSGQNAYLGEFGVKGVRGTDGIEALNTTGLPGFEEGLFACHTDPYPCAVILVPWKEIREGLKLPR